uniref:Uncharacterized protein n=1 Tax=Linum usitatissimum TaxID=4006 RepID=A0A172MLA8_LINUS|nr:hypothetical protein [Linum usitatissimum]
MIVLQVSEEEDQTLPLPPTELGVRSIATQRVRQSLSGLSQLAVNLSQTTRNRTIEDDENEDIIDVSGVRKPGRTNIIVMQSEDIKNGKKLSKSPKRTITSRFKWFRRISLE